MPQQFYSLYQLKWYFTYANHLRCCCGEWFPLLSPPLQSAPPGTKGCSIRSASMVFDKTLPQAQHIHPACSVPRARFAAISCAFFHRGPTRIAYLHCNLNRAGRDWNATANEFVGCDGLATQLILFIATIFSRGSFGARRAMCAASHHLAVLSFFCDLTCECERTKIMGKHR